MTIYIRVNGDRMHHSSNFNNTTEYMHIFELLSLHIFFNILLFGISINEGIETQNNKANGIDNNNVNVLFVNH